MLSSAGGGVEDGWFTRYGDPTQNTGGYNYFGGMSVENYVTDMPNGVNIYLDEARDTVWASFMTRYFADNNASPSGQATNSLAAFNATDGSWDSYAASQVWGNSVFNDGYALNALTSNRLVARFSDAQLVGYFNTQNRAWESNWTEIGNSTRSALGTAPVKVGNGYVSISNKNSYSAYVGYYENSNLRPTGSRKYSTDLSNNNGRYPAYPLAGSAITNWFSIARDSQNGFNNIIILKWSYNNLQSGKWLPNVSTTTGMNMYPQSMVADSSHVYLIYRSNSSRTNWIFKFDHSLNIVKQVKWSDSLSTDSYHGFNQARLGNDGNIHLFQTGNWGVSNRPFSRLIINKDLTAISDWITVNHYPQGTSSNSGTGGSAGSYGVELDSRDNAYFTGAGQLGNPYYYFGGQAASGRYLTVMKLPYGFSSTGTYDTSGSGNATYWGNNEVVISKPTIPTLTTVSNYTWNNYTSMSLSNENTNNTGNYTYSFGNDSTRLSSYSFDRENFSIT